MVERIARLQQVKSWLEDAIGLGIWQFTNTRKITSLCSFVSFVVKAKLFLLPEGEALFHPGTS